MKTISRKYLQPLIGLTFFIILTLSVLVGILHHVLIVTLALFICYLIFENIKSYKYGILPERYKRFDQFYGKSAAIFMTYLMTIVMLMGYVILLIDYLGNILVVN